MARQGDKTTSGDKTIARGTGNVFADLGYADAEERQAKLRLAHAINGVIARRCAWDRSKFLTIDNCHYNVCR